MLDSVCQETGNEDSQDRKDTHGTYRRKTPTLLLGGVYSSLQIIEGVENYLLGSELLDKSRTLDWKSIEKELQSYHLTH